LSRRFADPIALYRVLRTCWSTATTGAFDATRPARNQCSVTALAVQHYFGGEIVTTPTIGGTHFYDDLGGIFWDLSAEQFDEPFPMAGIASSRAAALADSSPERLAALLAGIERGDAV